MTEALQTMDWSTFALWITAVSFARYWTLAGIPYFVLYVWRPTGLGPYKIQSAAPAPRVVRSEFLWGNVSCVLIAASLLVAFLAWKAGWTQIYTDEQLHGSLWKWGSIAVMAVIHDTWFYWTHRLLHHPLFFKRFHSTHHLSLNPTPWASLSFHPVEEVVSFGFFPLMLFVIPFHPEPLAWFFLLMFAGNVSGHSGYELGRLAPWTRYVGGALHHNLHHTRVTRNFGLYTNFWDLACGTFATDFAAEYQRLALKARSRPETRGPKSDSDAPPRAG